MIKKNIAIVITRLDLGGAQKVALYLAENLDRKKYNVHLIAGKGGKLDEEVLGFKFEDKAQNSSHLKTSNLKLTVNLWEELVHPISPILDFLAVIKLISYFEKNKIDIVHTHSSKAGLLGRVAAHYADVPKIVHTVHGFPFHEYQNPIMHFIYVMLEKIAAKITTKLVSVGNDVTGYGLKKSVGTAEQYVMIRAAVDLKAFGGRRSEFGVKGKGRAKFLGQYGLAPDKFTVGMIGNLKKQKNPSGFIKVAAEAIKLDPDLQFIFAGGGDGMEDLVEMTRHYDIHDKVKFIGWVEKPEIFMASIDLFLLTSLWEGLPCTLAQAFAAGKPVVASDIGGNREFVEKFSAGWLYPPFDYKTAAREIFEAKRKMIKYEPRKKGFDEFELKDMLKKYERLFAGLF